MKGILYAKYCIIGSGIAGIIAAKELLKSGATGILMIEAGEVVALRSRQEWWQHRVPQVDPFSPYHDLESEYENTGGYEYPLAGSRLWAKGGTMLHWTGHAFRLKPEDFFLKANTGQGVDWPITYNTLEKYYILAEQTLKVAGDARDTGHPYRSDPYPLPAFPYTSDDAPYLRALTSLGFSYQHNCLSINPFLVHILSDRNLQTKDGYSYGSLYFTADQLFNDLEQEANFSLMTGVSALRINFSEKSRACSLRVWVPSKGSEVDIEAEYFVICCGGIESPKLLLNSANKFWQLGVGNDSGFVGRYFMEHLGIICRGSSNGISRNPEGKSPFNTACSRYFDDVGYQSRGKFIIEISDLSESRWLANMNNTQENFSFSLGALLESPPLVQNSIQLGKGKNRFGLYTTTMSYEIDTMTKKAMSNAQEVLCRILRQMGCSPHFPAPIHWWARHHMGTCRMSSSAASGVVDHDLRVHGTENVYLCSSAVFPTAGAANPTLTIAALAHRLGRHLASA